MRRLLLASIAVVGLIGAAVLCSAGRRSCTELPACKSDLAQKTLNEVIDPRTIIEIKDMRNGDALIKRWCYTFFIGPARGGPFEEAIYTIEWMNESEGHSGCRYNNGNRAVEAQCTVGMMVDSEASPDQRVTYNPAHKWTARLAHEAFQTTVNNGLPRQVVLGSHRGHRPSRHSPSDPASETERRHRLKRSIRHLPPRYIAFEETRFAPAYSAKLDLFATRFIQSRTLDVARASNVETGPRVPVTRRVAAAGLMMRSQETYGDENEETFVDHCGVSNHNICIRRHQPPD